jgi:hypothetical protein
MSDRPSGQGRDRCGARRRDGSGKTCGLPAGWGTGHVGTGPCRKHLGSTPAHETRARRVQAQEAAERFGLRVMTTAPAALQAELERSAGIVAFLTGQVAGLDPAGMVGGVSERRTGPGGEEAVVWRAAPHVWLMLLHQWSRHHAEVAASMARLHIDERTVDLTAAIGDRLATALDVALAGAGMPIGQRARVLSLLAGELA